MPKTGDQHLLARVREFDPVALETTYDRYSNGLYDYACRLLGDASAAEDCVGETFSRFLRALRSGQGPRDHLQAYLYRIAHNWITDHYRRNPPAEIPIQEETVHVPDTTGETAENNIRRRKVRAAIRRLTPDQREAVVLRYLEGWDNEDVARAMRRPVGAVKALQQRGIAALRRMLVGEESGL
ncbi:MAG: sigma-70 family RNA polymerase sigma factor [Anaerolineales bacterium]|nr:sigma-70 family RNA polymerase sigma factor [Anaerolineales bacterium]